MSDDPRIVGPPFYRVVRVRFFGREEIVKDILWRDTEDRSDAHAVRIGRNEQEERAEAFALAHELAAQGQHVRVYSSQDDGTLGPSDLIWDSKMSG